MAVDDLLEGRIHVVVIYHGSFHVIQVAHQVVFLAGFRRPREEILLVIVPLVVTGIRLVKFLVFMVREPHIASDGIVVLIYAHFCLPPRYLLIMPLNVIQPLVKSPGIRFLV